MLKGRVLQIFLYTFLFLVRSFAVSEVFFAPDDKPGDKLIKRIDAAKNEIKAAVYMLTDSRIVKALINANNRGVSVQVITDKISSVGEFGKVSMLAENGVPVWIFEAPNTGPKNKKFYNADSIMHNKFAVIDNFLWTGSFNWTRSANNKNQENVILTNDTGIVESYKNHFEVLKTRCIAYNNNASAQQPRSISRKMRAKMLKFVNVLRGKLTDVPEGVNGIE